MLKRAYFGLLLILCAASGVFAQGLPVAAPEAVGLSSERLERLKSVVQQYVEAGRIAGVVTIVARGGKVAHLESFGKEDVERNLPMRKDTIFRIASMSKAVTSVAIVMLMEEGKLLLSDPLSKYLPAFKQTTVGVAPQGSAPGGRIGIVPAKREVTIRDLLTHTAGISYGTGPAAAQWKAAGIQGWYLGDRKEPVATIVNQIAALPFDAQPGEQYVYGYSTDILGALVEKVSGMPLDQFFRTRIFEPLKMMDSSFFLPREKRDRLATVYSATPTGGITRAGDGGMGQGDYVDGPRVCFSGGAGLLSTAPDYARLLQMLLNGGELDGARVLGPKSVELMTVNHVGSLYDGTGGSGFGLGFEVIEDVGRSGRPGSIGTWGWGSAYYSRYFVDPREKLVAIIFSQLVPAGGLDLDAKFRVLVYQSIVGPLPPERSATMPNAPVRQKRP